MTATDPRVDAYISKAPLFANDILVEVRKRIHAAVPSVEETIKWNVPFFLYEGKILASMAAFKAHTKVGVWKDAQPTFVDVTSVEELPPAKTFAQSVKEAAKRLGGDGLGAATPPKRASASVKKAPARKR